MPPPFVRTIREELFYEYAKLISRSAFGTLQRGFITDSFKHLRDGEMQMSDAIREWEREHELPPECVFCGSKDDLSTDHLIPVSRGGSDSADNMVMSCRHCNSSRGDKGVFEWVGLKEKNYLHRLIAGKYLKMLFQMHEDAGTLDIETSTLHRLCESCPLPTVCAKWGTVNKLTCFCLESVLPKA